MWHSRQEVIDRTIAEFNQLEALLAGLSAADYELPLPRPEGKDPWTIKDAVVHIAHWKANATRFIKKEPRPVDERRLQANETNHLIYLRWRDRPVEEVLAWHRQVQQELLAALHSAPEKWFSGREHAPEWPFDLDGHSASHRVKDIERALALRR